MQLFYATNIQGGQIILEADEARHLNQVLRKRAGEEVRVVDGHGHRYTATLLEASRHEAVLRITDTRAAAPRAAGRVHLAVAPTKQMSRFEWLLEKATEIGVDTITPLRCFHSERRRLRPDRLQRVLVAAMKQSLRAWLPVLQPMTDLRDLLAAGLPTGEQGFIAHLGPGSKGPLQDNYRPGSDVTILIGPEGDFSAPEIEAALDAGYTAVTLGASRLRTETAGLVACHTIQLLQEK